MLEKLSLFEARTKEYHTFRIPGLLVTERGVVIASAEARRGRGGDYDDNDICLRRSLDGGKTWEPSRCLVPNQQYGPGPVSNFVTISDRTDGAVHVLYCHDYARVFYLRSDDDGATFSPAVEITGVFEEFRRDYPWRVVATGPAHGTQLRSGRLIVPLWMSDGSGKETGAKHRGHRPSVVSLAYSDDHGRTWRRGEIVCRNGDRVDGETVVNPSETIMAELADGRVLFNMRSESARHRRLIAISPDGVSAWSHKRFDEALLEPICMASLIRHAWPADSKPGRLLFANPDNLEKTMAQWACDRKRLTVKLSTDDGLTWPVSRVLEDGPAGYSDLAVLPDGTVLCLYECGQVSGMCDDKCLMLARFDLEWLS
jgi:sialidase-1